MAAKPRFRIRASALAVIATTIGFLAFASAALADTGGVYFDGSGNAAAGDPNALFNGSFTGAANVGLGREVMQNLTSGNSNVATGSTALLDDTTGSSNVATGGQALEDNTTGDDNIAIGGFALQDNTTGGANTATGYQALQGNGVGNFNVADGVNALQDTTGSSNIGIGRNAGLNLIGGGSFNIDIGNQGGNAAESKTIRVGTKGDQTRTFVAGISGKTVSGTGTPVVVNDKGQLGTASAVSAKSGAASSPSAIVARLRAQNRRQGTRIAALEREVAKLTAH